MEVGPLLLLLEGGEHGEDRRALLGSGGASLGEGPPVVQALDGEGDRRVGLPAPHEEGMDRVRQTFTVTVVLDRGRRGKHALGNHLSSIDPARELGQRASGEDVLPVTRRQVEDPGHRPERLLRGGGDGVRGCHRPSSSRIGN